MFYLHVVSPISKQAWFGMHSCFQGIGEAVLALSFPRQLAVYSKSALL